MQTLSQPQGVIDGFGQIVEKLPHRFGIFKVPLTVLRQQVASGIQMGVMADAGEDIQHLASDWFCVEHAIGGQQRQLVLSGKFGQSFDRRVLVAKMMTLYLDKEMLRAKNAQELFKDLGGGVNCLHQRTFFISAQRHQPLREFGQFCPADGALIFCRAQVGASEQAAQILITGSRLHQHCQHRAIFHGKFAADDGANAGLMRCGKKARRPIEAIAIAERHGRHSQLRSHLGQLLGQ